MFFPSDFKKLLYWGKVLEGSFLGNWLSTKQNIQSNLY